MAGPVRQSPRAVAAAPAEKKSVSLIEKFALQMGGVDSHKMLSTLKATAFRQPARKQGNDWVSPEVTNEQMMALLVVANKYDLNPFIKEIYAFPDKGGIVPIVGVDGWSRMINNHPQCDGMSFQFGESNTRVQGVEHDLPESCTCLIYRKDRKYPTEVTEYLDEVYRPPYNVQKPGPWQTHTRRMLRHKAMIQAARLAFGFTGIHDQDEAERIVEGESFEVPVEEKAQTLTDRFSEKKEEGLPLKEEETIVEETEEVIEGEVIEEARPKKKKPKKADISSDVMQKILAAESAEVIDEILAEVDEFKGISQAKRAIIKKAATARKKDL